MLTVGNGSDVEAAPALLERAGRMRYLRADKGYGVDRLRCSRRYAGAVPVILGRRNRKRTIRYDKDRFRGRPLTENTFYRLKEFLRVANQYDNSPQTSSQTWPSPLYWRSGSERVRGQ